MYITSDLFGGPATNTRPDAAASTNWTNMANTQHATGLGKRKRLDGEEGINTNCLHQQRLSPASRGHARLHPHNATSESNRTLSVYPPASASHNPVEGRPKKQLRRQPVKASLVKSTSHLMDIEPDPAPSSPANTHTHAATDLRPCHACKSAPKRRKDLENYLDCRRCEGRTCYICARPCFGGCGKAVCKKCVVEVGDEGDPWCLDCYARNINS